MSKRSEILLSCVLLFLSALVLTLAGAIAVYFLFYMPVFTGISSDAASAVLLAVSTLIIFSVFWFILSQGLFFSWAATKAFLAAYAIIITSVGGKYVYWLSAIN